ncbi:MAG TPA: hypothetical protein DCZ92_10385 [Elusimicrobia bacterium]|nr:MAG: hypothetical protein A2016_08070 [Elusimicrobia bacterium GWF2_62_30]HBA61202.1 hypothetical protein [Elusimicrobiota bacterium]
MELELRDFNGMKSTDVLGLWYGYKRIISTGFAAGQLETLKAVFKKYGFLCGMLDKTHDYKKQGGTCILSRDPGHIKTALAAYAGNRFDLIGRLLGYPECCVSYHYKTFYKFTDEFVRECSARSGKFLWPLNNVLDFDGRLKKVAAQPDFNGLGHASLISHNPCSYDCAKSLELAKKNYFYLNKHIRHPGPESDYSLLAKPVLYADDFNLAILNGKSVPGGAEFAGAAFILGFAGLEKELNAGGSLLLRGRVLSISRKGKVVLKKTLSKKPLVLPFDVHASA